MTNPVPLPQPDAYEYLIANVWRTGTHFNGVKANDHRCLYATEKMRAHAAAQSAADNAALRAERDALRDWVKDTGLMLDICTRNVLGKVCEYCQCKHRKATL